MRVSSVGIGARDLGTVTSTDPYVTSFVGPYANLGDLAACASCTPSPTGVPGYLPGSMVSLLDRPYKADASGLGLARAVGNVMGIKPLSQAKSSDYNMLMVRATNLASLTTAWLLRFKPEARLRALENVTDIAWANKILAFTGKLPGVVGISDGIRFSLGMHFLVGLLELGQREETDNSRAYVAFAVLFKIAEADLRGEPRDSITLNGLGGLGQAKAGCEWWDVGCLAKQAGDAIASGAQAAAKAVVQTAKNVTEGIQKAADFGTDLICKGLKGLLGDAIGGAICWIITKGLQIIVSSAKMLVELVSASLTGLLDFVKALAKGDFMGAIKALLATVTKMLFLLFLPISEPFMGIKADKLKELGDRVAEKHPFFVLTLITAILGLASPSTAAIITLVLALTPAICALLGPTVKSFTKTTLDEAELAIEKFVKLALVVYQGVMSVAAIFGNLRTQLTEYLQKKGGFGALVKDTSNNIMTKLQASWSKIMNSFTTGKFGDISTGLNEIVKVVPDVFGALLTDAKGAVPAIDDTIKAIMDAPKSVAEREKELEKMKGEIEKSLSPEKRVADTMKKAEGLPPTNAGVTVARVFASQFALQKDPAKKQEFLRAMQAEIARVSTA